MASNTYQVAFALNSRLNSGFAKNFNMATQHINNMVKVAKTAAASLTAAFSIKNTLGTGLTEAMNLEGYRMQLETATKSAEKAGDIMNWSVNLANSTPFETGSVVEASARLEAMGLAAKTYLPMIGDMAGATNKDLIQATEAIIDAQAGELERLKEFGIKKSDIVEYAYNKMGQIQVVNNQGQITNQEKFNEAMLALMDEKFKGGMEKQAKTLKGVWSTVTGVTKTALANIVGITNEGTVKQGSLLEVVKNNINDLGTLLMNWQSSGVFIKMSESLGRLVSRAGQGINFVKKQITGVMPTIINGFKSLKAWGVIAFENIKQRVSENEPIITKFKGIIEQLKTQFVNLKASCSHVFENMKPVLAWLQSEGLPAAIDCLMTMGEKALDVYHLISNNWQTIGPIIAGVVAALVTYKTVTLAARAATATYMAVTKGMALAQQALNVVLNMSPLGWICLLIGAVVTAGIYLYKNWDTIKVKALELWGSMHSAFKNISSFIKAIFQGIVSFLTQLPIGTGLLQNIQNMIASIKIVFSGLITFVTGVFTGNWQQAWEGVKTIFQGVFSSLVAIVAAPVNTIISLINSMIDKVNGINITIPDWVPGLGGKSYGMSIPKIPMFAKGSTGFNTPDTFIAGEKGAELVTNARGYKVFNHAQTKGLLQPKGSRFGSTLQSENNQKVEIAFNPQITVTGGNENIVQEILSELIKYEPVLIKKILQALNKKVQNERRLDYYA